MISTLTLYLVYFAWLAFGLKRAMTYLHPLQQDDYDNSRFLRWMVENKVFDKKLSAALLAIAIFSFFLPVALTHILLVIAFGYMAYAERDPRFNAKKKFVVTIRARRILGITLFCVAIAGAWWFVLPVPLFWIFCVQALPMLLALANAALHPAENKIQKKYWDEAHAKLLDYKPLVIGITGSFGKTSVKHILGHILKTQAPTLITPGSVNTAMGTARIIRERLQPEHKYFIAEMGAYGPGSIEKLCRLTPPDLGIITAIGAAHYERFKSLETVAAAKFELAQAVEQKNGKIVIPSSVLKFTHTQKMREANKANYIVCGEGADDTGSDMHIQAFRQTKDGLELDLLHNGTPINLKAPLYGQHHAMNIALAYAAALSLGVSAEDAITALRSVPQIQHRLEVKPQSDGTILIDDAFNSNPAGFAAALDLLPVLAGDDNRRILITPGMVELGAAHDEAHEEIGARAGKICDIVVLVQPERVPSFIRGFRKTGPEKSIVEVRRFVDAAHWLQRNTQGGDVILIENDLPDLYENLPKI